jgi:O-methyltransferase
MMLDKKSFTGASFNIQDVDKFRQAIKLLEESLAPSVSGTLHCADNLITWNRNYSFLRQSFFLEKIECESLSVVEKSIMWRTYILLYFAELSLNIEGDFVEAGVLKGTTAESIVEKLDLKKAGKKLYLYDLFEWSEDELFSKMVAHEDEHLFEAVCARFSDREEVSVVRGRVPDSFEIAFPLKIAFAHIDMNNSIPEVAALVRIIAILSPGGAVILDDYGWWGYSEQKLALDPIIDAAGLSVLELPTGQGLIIKPIQ